MLAVRVHRPRVPRRTNQVPRLGLRRSIAFCGCLLAGSCAIGASAPCTPAAVTAAARAASGVSDVTPPVTSIAGADARWHDIPVTLVFTAVDDPGGSGMEGGQARTEYQLDGGEWVTGNSCTVPAPDDHSGDGVHTVGYRSTDAAGNAETPGAVAVSIDTQGPITSALFAGGRRGQVISLSYRIDDALSQSATSVTIIVRNDHGAAVKRFAVGAQTTSAWHAVGWMPTAPGSFTFAVTAADLAGNRAIAVHSAPITVRSEWAVVGHSSRGRRIFAARFGSGNRHLLVIGGVHGDELGTAVAARFAAYLATHPAAVPRSATIDVIRCLNPDGYARRTRGSARRVDLNRNLPTADWRRVLKRGDPSALLGLSGGARPASEPETRALLACLKRGFAAVVSLHSHAGIVDYNGSGGFTLARRMSSLCGLPVGHVSYQSSITGSLGEYVPAKYGIPVITLELRSPVLRWGLRSALLEAAR
jgi:murein peptide amidase A